MVSYRALLSSKTYHEEIPNNFHEKKNIKTKKKKDTTKVIKKFQIEKLLYWIPY